MDPDQKQMCAMNSFSYWQCFGYVVQVLKKLVENMKQNVNERLLLDLSNFRSQWFQIQGKMVMQPQPPNQLGSEQTFNDI